MSINKKGIDLIKSFESLKLTAYLCPAGVLTIGYGHTGRNVKEGMTITIEQAEKLLQDDLAYAERRVNSMLVDRRIRRMVNENQFTALVSLAFNIGIGAFQNSTVLKRLLKKDFISAGEAMLLWNKVRNPKSGELEVSNGLVRRREAELLLYKTPPNQKGPN